MLPESETSQTTYADGNNGSLSGVSWIRGVTSNANVGEHVGGWPRLSERRLVDGGFSGTGDNVHSCGNQLYRGWTKGRSGSDPYGSPAVGVLSEDK